MSFITDLQQKRCNYNHPDQATSQANSLILLSSGIYTEEERFVFELLQNAVDAHNDESGTLDVEMIIEKDYFVFLHNGEPFSERDIEGLCDVGNGNKMKDVKKIGYKGIGFKSVFMRSSNVTVQSGEYCFKFDKLYWENYWDNNWDTKMYGPKDVDREYLMPWQIIPIETTQPIDSIDLNGFDSIDLTGYNVATFIQISDTHSLERKISKLLSSSQFLLFLRSKNINMTFIVNGRIVCWISKMGNDNQVVLSRNGVEESRWLIHTNENVEVPSHLKEKINADINTPNKLKDAKTFDLSFAIALDGGKLKQLEQNDAVVYTYLPTSFRFGTKGLPFLVNANFITDAGRQQLHKDSEWNKLIFSKIPYEFLTWMKDLSSQYKNYWEVLPDTSYGRGNALEEVYEDEMKKAMASIAFIPRLSNTKQKVLASNAVMDRMNVSDAITKGALINHINRTYSRNFTTNDMVANIWRGSRILGEYGVFIFDKNKLKGIFEDKNIFENIDIELNKTLINYLYKYYYENKQEQGELISILCNTKFLMDEDLNLQCPTDLFFPSSYKEQNELAEDAKILHPEIYKAIEDNFQIKDWLKELGVETLSDITFIKNVICKNGYITKNNAVDAVRFLFEINKKINIFEEVGDYYISKLKLLSKNGRLADASDLYLGSNYHPETDLEPLYSKDIYVSDEYGRDCDIKEMAHFLQRLKVNESITIKPRIISESSVYQKYLILNDAKENSKKMSWHSDWTGGDYRFNFEYFELNYIPLINIYYEDDFSFAKYVWSKILQQELIESEDYIRGNSGLYKRTLLLKEYDGNISFLEFCIKNIQKFPVVDGSQKKATELFLNTEDIKILAGNYLPIIDVDCDIHDSWQNLLNLRNTITINDCLTILTKISDDKDNITSNRDRISKIYQRLVDLDALSKKNQITIMDWASKNRILSKDDEFVYPSELSHITLDGFSSKNRVYIGNPPNKEMVIELLSMMGVKIITEHSIKPKFNGKKESEILKKILKGRLSPLALVSAGETPSLDEYQVHKKKLGDLLKDTHFYHCDTIGLTYGNADDIIEKHTFGNKNEFYYIGDLRPANIDPLLTPLCRYLNLKEKERELFIMMVEDMEGIRQYLNEKGYDISMLEEEPIIHSGNIQVTFNQPTDESAQERNLITGFKGEIIVYEKLKSMGYNPQCLSISTADDYDREIILNGKTYYCNTSVS